jgi:carotenoid cleavage dioxygenase-like enzyme
VYPNEPVFVPNPHGTSEDDGVILADVMYTEDNSTYLVILNASNMEEIGRAGPTPRIIPHGFHGRYLVW